MSDSVTAMIRNLSAYLTYHRYRGWTIYLTPIAAGRLLKIVCDSELSLTVSLSHQQVFQFRRHTQALLMRATVTLSLLVLTHMLLSFLRWIGTLRDGLS